MTKQEAMKQAWDEWHKHLPKGLMPERPNSSFEVGFNAGVSHERTILLAEMRNEREEYER